MWRKLPDFRAERKAQNPVTEAREKSTKINSLGPETARWGGNLPREGVVAEKLAPSLKVCLPWVSKRGIWDIPGILPGCPGPLGVFKKFVQKKFVRIFRSLVTSVAVMVFSVPKQGNPKTARTMTSGFVLRNDTWSSWGHFPLCWPTLQFPPSFDRKELKEQQNRATGPRAWEREICLWEGLWEECFQRFFRGF